MRGEVSANTRILQRGLSAREICVAGSGGLDYPFLAIFEIPKLGHDISLNRPEQGYHKTNIHQQDYGHGMDHPRGGRVRYDRPAIDRSVD
jgi:hypothetical protein